MNRGFTLIELLVVILLIAILVGMAIPAIQAIRASARLTHCKNNLRQVAIAMLHFESANANFPPGQLCPSSQFPERDPEAHQLTGHLVYAFPFLEQSEFFESLGNMDMSTSNVSPAWYLDPDSWNNSNHRLLILTCPSDVPGGGNALVTTSYTIDGLTRFALLTGEQTVSYEGWTNYLGCSGDLVDSDHRGIFFGRKQVSTGEISDGLSSTILLGETAGGVEESENQTDSITGVPVVRASFMMNGLSVEKHGFFREPYGDGQVSSHLVFASRHRGKLASFARCDGSVEAIAADIDPVILRALSTRNGNE